MSGCKFKIITVVSDIGLLEAPGQTCVIERRDIAQAAGRTLDDMDVKKFQLVELVDDVIEQWLRIGV